MQNRLATAMLLAVEKYLNDTYGHDHKTIIAALDQMQKDTETLLKGNGIEWEKDHLVHLSGFDEVAVSGSTMLTELLNRIDNPPDRQQGGGYNE